jgi:predicted membrane-bound spermidine synthase
MARHAALFLLFFLSGISGLIYESIWSRYIRQFVGSAATAQVLVLSLFMGGMALGALLVARRLSNVRRPVRVYGLIEGGIGLYALAFPWLCSGVMRLCYDTLFPALGGGLLVAALKWTMAGLLILPPCVLLGMTFPLMSAGILRRDREHSGEILSFLYFTNSIGAALGALLSGFVLVGRFGLPGTLACAAALNIAIAVVALLQRGEHAPIVAAPEDSHDPTLAKRRAGLVRLLLLVSFGTGLSSFMYEIGWIRLLSMIIGSATHSFEVMLSAFVFGLAAGGLWVRGKMDRFRRPELVLGFVQILMGVAAVATLPLYALAVQAMGGLMATEVRTETTWFAFNALRYGLCLVIMFPATFCAGMTLPLITHLLLKRGQSEGIIGRVYGFNTLGAIAGATLAGLLLMPLIGLQRVIVGGAVVDILLGIALLRLDMRSDAPAPGMAKTFRLACISSALVVVFGLFIVKLDPMVLSSTVYRHGRTRLGDGYELISYVDGRTASVTVIRLTDEREYRVIYTNGKPDASLVLNRYPAGRDPKIGPDIAGDEPNQILVGLIPLAIRPEATDAALIGFGSGVTCHVLLGSPTLERLDTIEIEPEMYAGSRNFLPVNERAYNDARNHFWFDDAKAFFAGAARQYDIIVSEPTNPWVSGVSSLFTVEFYREAKRYLKPRGVLAQWLQGYELSNELLLTVLAALDQEFNDYQILRVGDSDWVILAVADGELGELSPAPLKWPALDGELKVIGVHDIGQLDSLLVANRKMLHPFLADKPANSDAHPRLDTGAEKARFMQDSAGVLHSLRWTPAPLLEVLGGLKRRPYPADGIGDLRAPHVFLETEQASAMMRLYEDPTVELGDTLVVTVMNEWIDEQRKVEADKPDWGVWIVRTYAIFTQTAPHLALADTRWWAEVRSTVAREDTPPELRSIIDTLDALLRRDGARLQAGLDDLRARGSTLLSAGMMSIAGMIALELQHADEARRREYGAQRMADIAGTDPSAENLAYQILRAYAER